MVVKHDNLYYNQYFVHFSNFSANFSNIETITKIMIYPRSENSKTSQSTDLAIHLHRANFIRILTCLGYMIIDRNALDM